jgi:hypothetical protein
LSSSQRACFDASTQIVIRRHITLKGRSIFATDAKSYH